MIHANSNFQNYFEKREPPNGDDVDKLRRHEKARLFEFVGEPNPKIISEIMLRMGV
jgi:hypothetical protein